MTSINSGKVSVCLDCKNTILLKQIKTSGWLVVHAWWCSVSNFQVFRLLVTTVCKLKKFIWEIQNLHRPVFFLDKGHAMRKLEISTGAFQGHQGNDQGNGGNRLRCLRKVTRFLTHVFSSTVINKLMILRFVFDPPDFLIELLSKFSG